MRVHSNEPVTDSQPSFYNKKNSYQPSDTVFFFFFIPHELIPMQFFTRLDTPKKAFFFLLKPNLVYFHVGERKKGNLLPSVGKCLRRICGLAEEIARNES